MFSLLINNLHLLSLSVYATAYERRPKSRYTGYLTNKGYTSGMFGPVFLVLPQQVVVCPRSPVMDSELGDGWLEGSWSPEIADFLGAWPFDWLVGWAAECCSGLLPCRCSHRVRMDNSGNAVPGNLDILGSLVCRRSLRSGRRSMCPTRCSRSNGWVWQEVPMHDVDFVGRDWL